MAIINSVLIGKGRGKVGNVVLSNLKGQTVLKSLNSSPSNPKSPDQTAQRSKMAYAVKVWQIVFMFMANFKSYIKPLESGYNAFIRSAIKVITTPLTFDFATIWTSLVTAMDLKGNLDITFSSLSTVSALNITLINTNFTWNNTLTFNYLMANNSGESLVSIAREITETEFNAKAFSIPFDNGTIDYIYCYFSSSATKQNTAIVVPGT